jgi:hypothetical protein
MIMIQSQITSSLVVLKITKEGLFEFCFLKLFQISFDSPLACHRRWFLFLVVMVLAVFTSFTLTVKVLLAVKVSKIGQKKRRTDMQFEALFKISFINTLPLLEKLYFKYDFLQLLKVKS